MSQLAYSIWTACYLNDTKLTNNADYEKQIYVKNKHWNPPPSLSIIEINWWNLKRQQKHVIAKHNKRNLRALTYSQICTLWVLKNNSDLIIKPSGKNLGSVIIDTHHYIKQVLTEHLLSNDYKWLSMTKAHHRMEQVQTYLKSILHEHQEILSKTKLTYFQKTLKNGTDYQSSIAFLRFIKPFLPSD